MAQPQEWKCKGLQLGKTNISIQKAKGGGKVNYGTPFPMP